jgi:hypothetical protein
VIGPTYGQRASSWFRGLYFYSTLHGQLCFSL